MNGAASGNADAMEAQSGRETGQDNKEDASVVKISIDAMGGDVGPEVCIAGAAIALDREPDPVLFPGF